MNVITNYMPNFVSNMSILLVATTLKDTLFQKLIINCKDEHGYRKNGTVPKPYRYRPVSVPVLFTRYGTSTIKVAQKKFGTIKIGTVPKREFPSLVPKYKEAKCFFTKLVI